ncbi:hypothetical protein PCE1_000518 [Barthelona sp. PCE]
MFKVCIFGLEGGFAMHRIAGALCHEKTYKGVIWPAFRDYKSNCGTEIRFWQEYSRRDGCHRMCSRMWEQADVLVVAINSIDEAEFYIDDLRSRAAITCPRILLSTNPEIPVTSLKEAIVFDASFDVFLDLSERNAGTEDEFITFTPVMECIKSFIPDKSEPLEIEVHE